MWNIELHEIARKERYRRWILGWNYVWTCRRLFMQIRQFVDTRGKKIRICIEILSCFLNATSNIFHSITNVFDGLFSSKNETFEYRKHVLLFHGKKKEKGVTSNFFPFQRHSDFHEYRIHQSPRTFSEFYIPFCLSSLRKYENSLDSVTRANSSHAPRRGAFHPDDGGKMDRVCCRRAKKEWKKKKKDIRICLVRGWGEGRGWRTQAWSLWQGIVVCIYDTYANGTPFARANRLRFARSSRHAPIQITVHQAAYSRRYGTTPLKLTRRGKIIGESFVRSRSKALNIRSGEIILCYLFYRWIDRDNILFIFENWRKMELE